MRYTNIVTPLSHIYFKNKIVKSKKCVFNKVPRNVLQFMFPYIIRTPLLELKSVEKSADYTRGRTVVFLSC